MAGRGAVVKLETGPAVAMLQRALNRDATPFVKAVFRRVALSYARVTRDRLRAATKDTTGNLRKATKHKGTQGGGAKVYIDKSGGSSGKGYHWHLVERGSKERATRKGASRGRMPADPYVNQVTDTAASDFGAVVLPEVVKQIRRKLEGGK